MVTAPLCRREWRPRGDQHQSMFFVKRPTMSDDVEAKILAYVLEHSTHGAQRVVSLGSRQDSGGGVPLLGSIATLRT